MPNRVHGPNAQARRVSHPPWPASQNWLTGRGVSRVRPCGVGVRQLATVVRSGSRQALKANAKPAVLGSLYFLFTRHFAFVVCLLLCGLHFKLPFPVLSCFFTMFFTFWTSVRESCAMCVRALMRASLGPVEVSMEQCLFSAVHTP